MPIIRSFGTLASFGDPQPTWSGAGSGSLNLYGSTQTYGEIYRRQPSVRTCVDFIARNVAQLGLHVFRRASDTDRERLPSHQLARLIARPNPHTTRYRLIESLLQDLGIYFSAYWLKVGDPLLGIVRLPPEQMSIEGGLLPSSFYWTTPTGQRKEFAPHQIVYFSGYSPNGLAAISPLETLRRVLAEDYASGVYRQQFWENAGRQEVVIERPIAAGGWTPTQIQTFVDQWKARTKTPGGMVVLQDGMTAKTTSFNSKENEYLGARKLTREEVAAEYHIPLPMVGILDHATFSNIKEQHKQLYQDCLGPWLVMVEEEIERQLLPDTDASEDVYVEFNIAEKMKGSFEEQAASLQLMTGRPVMTGNEARARLNLPRITDDPTMDQVAKQQGGPAASAAGPVVDGQVVEDEESDAQVAAVVRTTQARIQKRLAKVPEAERLAAFNSPRFTRELAKDLAPYVGEDRARSMALQVIAKEQQSLARVLDA